MTLDKMFARITSSINSLFLIRRTYPLLFMAVLLSVSTSWAYDSNRIRYFQTDSRYDYRIKLLRLALEKTVDNYGPFGLVPYEGSAEITQARGLYELEKNNYDVAFLPFSHERDKRFLPVRIDIMKGLLGLRLFLIHKDNEDKFKKIIDFQQLKDGFSAGFCDQWSDIEILKANGIKVASTSAYTNLFPMLSYKRFDYFPRGIGEIWKEMEMYGSSYPNIAIEKQLALYYPMPVYFFVNLDNKALAKRIEEGLLKAENDGSFKRLFLDEHKEALEKVDLANRRIFKMFSPDLKSGIPEPDTSWWMKPPPK